MVHPWRVFSPFFPSGYWRVAREVKKTPAKEILLLMWSMAFITQAPCTSSWVGGVEKYGQLGLKLSLYFIVF